MQLIDVVAAVLRHPVEAARVLLTQRPPNKVRGGLWEFPGGKLEAGESAAAALHRELAEELGIQVESSQPLFALQHDYPDVRVRLLVREVTHWSGRIQTLQVSAIEWQNLPCVTLTLSSADLRIARLLTLPRRYAISADCAVGNESHWLEAFAALPEDHLVLVRTPSLPRTAQHALLKRLLSQQTGVVTRLLLSGDTGLAAEFGMGVHLRSRQLDHVAAPSSSGPWRAGSCHDQRELHAAHRAGCDFVTLAPVQATLSHPSAQPLGWSAFQRLTAAAGLPVFALGGLDSSHLPKIREAGGWGVAGIRGFWPTSASA